MSFGAVLLAAGSKGKRYALPNARIMIHQPLIYGEGLSGQVTDIAIEAKELENTKTRLTEILAKHTGKTPEQIMKDSDRDNYMNAEEAQAYGIVDHVVSSVKDKVLAGVVPASA